MRSRLTPFVLRGIVRSVAMAVPAIAACGGAVSSVENNGDPSLGSSGGQTDTSGSGARSGGSGGSEDSFGSTSSGSSSGAIYKDASDAPYDAGDACNSPCGCYKPESKTKTIDVATWCAGAGAGSEYCKDPSVGDCNQVCPQQEYGGNGYPLFMTFCSNDTDANGKAIVTCNYNGPPCGRRPAGFEAVAVGGWFARCAELEDASIEAFHVLDEELAALGAPRALRKRARRAAVDEVRHTESMSDLARRAGHDVARRMPSASARAPRSAFDIALENAVEGCVREAYGALLAMWQADSARDERVAQAMKEIAHDEARHAALAWDVHRWLAPRLDDDQRARVADAMKDALDTLAKEVLDTPADDRLGLPDAMTATALVNELRVAVMS